MRSPRRHRPSVSSSNSCRLVAGSKRFRASGLGLWVYACKGFHGLERLGVFEGFRVEVGFRVYGVDLRKLKLERKPPSSSKT